MLSEGTYLTDGEEEYLQHKLLLMWRSKRFNEPFG